MTHTMNISINSLSPITPRVPIFDANGISTKSIKCPRDDECTFRSYALRDFVHHLEQHRESAEPQDPSKSRVARCGWLNCSQLSASDEFIYEHLEKHFEDAFVDVSNIPFSLPPSPSAVHLHPSTPGSNSDCYDSLFGPEVSPCEPSDDRAPESTSQIQPPSLLYVDTPGADNEPPFSDSLPENQARVDCERLDIEGGVEDEDKDILVAFERAFAEAEEWESDESSTTSSSDTDDDDDDRVPTNHRAEHDATSQHDDNHFTNPTGELNSGSSPEPSREATPELIGSRHIHKVQSMFPDEKTLREVKATVPPYGAFLIDCEVREVPRPGSEVHHPPEEPDKEKLMASLGIWHDHENFMRCRFGLSGSEFNTFVAETHRSVGTGTTSIIPNPSSSSGSPAEMVQQISYTSRPCKRKLEDDSIVMIGSSKRRCVVEEYTTIRVTFTEVD